MGPLPAFLCPKIPVLFPGFFADGTKSHWKRKTSTPEPCCISRGNCWDKEEDWGQRSIWSFAPAFSVNGHSVQTCHCSPVYFATEINPHLLPCKIKLIFHWTWSVCFIVQGCHLIFFPVRALRIRAALLLEAAHFCPHGSNFCGANISPQTSTSVQLPEWYKTVLYLMMVNESWTHWKEGWNKTPVKNTAGANEMLLLGLNYWEPDKGSLASCPLPFSFLDQIISFPLLSQMLR